MGALSANSQKEDTASELTKATPSCVMASTSGLVHSTSRLQSSRHQTSRSPHQSPSPHPNPRLQLEKARSAPEGSQGSTWTEAKQSTQRRSSNRSKIREVPKFATRCRHLMSNSETGGDVVEPTHSLSIITHCVYIYITLGAVQLMCTALFSFYSTRPA